MSETLKPDLDNLKELVRRAAAERQSLFVPRGLADTLDVPRGVVAVGDLVAIIRQRAAAGELSMRLADRIPRPGRRLHHREDRHNGPATNG